VTPEIEELVFNEKLWGMNKAYIVFEKLWGMLRPTSCVCETILIYTRVKLWEIIIF